MENSESNLRIRLGIPASTQQVLIFGESSHWDPNWLFTSEEYFKKHIQGNLDLALNALQAEPKRVYSIECMFFLRMYWERNPGKQPLIRELVNQHRLRLTSSGVTTADTILPSAEAILRDLLIGQEWLRNNGMDQEPRLAYFTDSFGVSPFLPSLLQAAGFDRTAITRVDGMFFGGADLESGRRFPLPGSTAYLLSKEIQTNDFIWRDPNSAEVLCHWNAFGYGQGDMLAYRGLLRIFNRLVGRYDPNVKHIARRIAGYASQIAPLSKTPYLYCPIGFDFNGPIPRLTELLNAYNEFQYPKTGIWAVNAGLDDYLSLVENYRQQLPVLQLDPNPYWTGFYTSRPALKKRCRELVDRLLLTERLSAQLSLTEPESIHLAKLTKDSLAPAWWDAVTANHHDFITGTSPDRVVEKEQQVMLSRALKQVEKALHSLQDKSNTGELPAPVLPDPLWRPAKITLVKQPRAISVITPGQTVIFDTSRLEIQQATADGKAYLLSSSHLVVDYFDSGGLWRMGHEYRGGVLREERSQQTIIQSPEVQDTPYGKHFADSIEVSGETLRRHLWFFDEYGVILGRVEGRAPRRHTLCLRWQTPALSSTITMGAVGGVITRPLSKIYTPTFWPVQDCAHVQYLTGNNGLAFFFRYPAAIACEADGRIDMVALRNATGERLYGFIPLPATPANGYEEASYCFDYALYPTPGGDWRSNRLDQIALHLLPELWAKIDLQTGAFNSPVRLLGAGAEHTTIQVITLKPASRSSGWIARLQAMAAPPGELYLEIPGVTLTAAWRCDARERDLQPLPVENGQVRFTMAGTIETLRLV